MAQKKQTGGDANWQRFNAYLSPEQMTWLRQTRGKYMTDSGKELGNTDLIRIAIAELQAKEWPELKPILDKYPRRGTR